MNKHFFGIALVLCVGPALGALPPLPVEGLTGGDRALLEKGRPLIRELDSMDKALLSGEGAAVAALRKIFSDADPNFLAEALFVLPVKEGTEETVMEEAVNLLRGILAFDDIPYYSKQNGTWNKLFEETRILELPIYSPESSGVLVHQRMRPFEPGKMLYRFTAFPKEDSWLFSSENMDPMQYRFMKAVKPGNMNTALLIEKHPGALVFYGLGGARAFNFFGMFGDRLDVAFLGRIEAFFSWFYDNFVVPRMQEQ
jgi:hypothetical protein